MLKTGYPKDQSLKSKLREQVERERARLDNVKLGSIKVKKVDKKQPKGKKKK